MIKHLRIASDLHLEGFSGRDPGTLVIDFLPHDDRDAESLLILAGDITSHPHQLVGFIQACQQRFPRVLFIPGNHEYYKHNYQAWNAEMSDRLRMYCPGLVYALGSVGYWDEAVDLRIIFSTLWADGGPTLQDRGQVGFYLNDFRLITYNDLEHENPRKFGVPDMIYEHGQQKAKIEEYLKQSYGGRTVVVTHHLPSRRLVSPRFWPGDGSDGANGGFVGDCDSLLAGDHAPDLWIHGHTHDTVDTRLWRTRIVANPAGYRGEWSSQFNTFMSSEPRSDGTKKAVVQPKFVEIANISGESP